MSAPHSGQGMRRGFLIALAGVAVWLLAIILSGHVSGSIETADAGLIAYATETMQAWLRTPGLEVWQLAAYAGIAMIVVGPAWFWVIGPASEGWREGLSVPAIFGASESVAVVEHVTDGGNAEIEASEESSRPEPAAAEMDQIFSADPGSRASERAHGLLEAVGHLNGPLVPETPEGDFLRSSRGRDSAGAGDDGDSSQPARAQVRYTEPDQDTMDEKEQLEESVSAPAPESVEESKPVPNDDIGSASEPVRTPQRRDPAEAIATAVGGAREKLATVRSQMPPVDGTSSVDPAHNGLSSVEPISGETIRAITEES